MNWRSVPCAQRPRRGVLRRTTNAVVILVMGGAVAWACAPGGGGVATALQQQPVALAATAQASLLPVPEPPAAVMPDLAAELEESARAASVAPALPEFPVAATLEMSSTAYCLRGNMRTGVPTRDGMAAGDPSVLPLGSVVRVRHTDGRPVGVFVIMDTGGAVRGNKIDIYMESCAEARRWGRRPVVAEVMDIGRV